MGCGRCWLQGLPLPQFAGSIINWRNATAVAQWVAPRSSLIQPATDNGVRDIRFKNTIYYTPCSIYRELVVGVAADSAQQRWEFVVGFVANSKMQWC